MSSSGSEVCSGGIEFIINKRQGDDPVQDSAQWNATRAVIKAMRGRASTGSHLITAAFNYICLARLPRGLRALRAHRPTSNSHLIICSYASQFFPFSFFVYHKFRTNQFSVKEWKHRTNRRINWLSLSYPFLWLCSQRHLLFIWGFLLPSK